MEIVDVEGKLDLDEFLTRPIFAHLATAHEEGPRESPVWFVWEEDALWIIGHETDTFPKRIAEEPRCAIGLVDFDVKSGFLHHVGFRGIATIEPIENERSHRILAKYIGDDREKWDKRRFGKDLEAEGKYLFVKFIPETAVLRDQSYEVQP